VKKLQLPGEGRRDSSVPARYRPLDTKKNSGQTEAVDTSNNEMVANVPNEKPEA